MQQALANITSGLSLVVILAVLAGGTVLGVWVWKQVQGNRVVPAATQANEVEQAPPLIPRRRSVPAVVRADSQAVEVAELETAEAESYAGTATVLAADSALAIVGIRRVRPGLLYEFRGRRYDRYELHLLTGDVRIMTVQQPLPLIQVEAQPQLALGYNGAPLVAAGLTFLRVSGVHVGALVGLELGTADLVAAPGISITPFRTLSIGAWRDLVEPQWFVSTGITF